MKQLGQFINKKRLVAPKALDQESVKYVFAAVISQEYGRQGSANVYLELFRDGKVFVGTRSSNWANEIWLNRDYILHRLSGELESDAIREIVLAK